MRAVLLALLVPVAVAQDAATKDAQKQEPNAVEFVRDVAPILEQRCVSCHGPKKQKGKLRLDRKEHLFHGDEADWKVQPGKPDDSELLRRVKLPVGDEDVMPNEGPRLSDAQIDTLRKWIAAGADWPEKGDAFFVAAEQRALVPKVDFGIAAPDAATQARIDAAIEALVARGAVAQRVAADTPAVDVNASLLGKAFGDADLALLADLAPVLVWLNLARTAVTDEGIKALGPLQQLRRLNLSRTAVGDAGLRALGTPARLEVLNVYGSKVGDQGMLALAAWPGLQKVYAFETAVTADGGKALVAAKPGIEVDRGDYADARLAAAEAEIAARKERDRPVNTTCPVTGEKIADDQVVEHDGLRIAFCCGKCKAKFTKDPTAFAEKIAEYKAAAAAAAAQQKAEAAPAGKDGKPTAEPAGKKGADGKDGKL
jgi:mono/diheme cytochrome c family protein